MKTTMKLCKSSFGRLIAFILCFVMTFTFIPFIDSEGTTANAETQTPTIQLGDYVQMGTYYGEPILWRCVAFYKVGEDGTVDLTNPKTEYQEGYLPLMLSDKVLCLKAFDAAGDVTTGSHGRGLEYNGIKGYYRQTLDIYMPSPGKEATRSGGSSYWGDSNIRDWLNSKDQTVIWTCGNAPDEDHVFKGYNAYDTEAGFLTNFTEGERSCMKTVIQDQYICQKEYDEMDETNGVSGQNTLSFCGDIDVASEDLLNDNNKNAYRKKITDTMFLLNVNQVTQVYLNEGTLGENYFIGIPTAECLANNEGAELHRYTNNVTYWLSSAYDKYYPGSGCWSGCVNEEGCSWGCIATNYSCIGNYGVRPAFYLNLSSTSFNDGTGTPEDPFIARDHTPDKPEITINYKKEQTVQEIADTIEYQIDGADEWTSGNGENVGLLPETTYNFRVKATYSADASEVTVITTPSRPSTPSEPTVESKTDTTVTLSPTADCEYKCDNGDWQDSTEFTGLTEGQTYTFYQRVKATESAFCSDKSDGKAVDIKFAAPTVSFRTFTSITLKPIEGYVYKCGDAGSWQDSNVFTGLETGQTYTFYQKEKNSDDKYASESLDVKTLTYDGDVITSAVGITGVTAYLAVIAKNKLISKWFLTSNGIFGKKVNCWVKNFWTNMMR